jgi:hypothetical protein
VNNKIKGLDKALELIHHSKANKEELSRVTEVIERSKVATLEKDISKLVEEKVEEIRASMDKEKQSLREAF